MTESVPWLVVKSARICYTWTFGDSAIMADRRTIVVVNKDSLSGVG